MKVWSIFGRFSNAAICAFWVQRASPFSNRKFYIKLQVTVAIQPVHDAPQLTSLPNKKRLLPDPSVRCLSLAESA